MSESLFLNYVGTTVRFEIAADAASLLAPVLHFFGPSVGRKGEHREAFHVRVGVYREDEAERWLRRDGTPVQIRRSTAPEFCLDAVRVEAGARCVYVNGHTIIDAPADCAAGEAAVFALGISAGSRFQLIDFVRDLLLREHESRGTVVLHAAAVVADGRLLAIAGSKGAGKTTALLHSLRRKRCSYFSGDKLFCVPDGDRVLAHAWPDWPHIGVGTLRHVPWLSEHVARSTEFDLAALPAMRKLLLDPERFHEWIGFTPSGQPRELAGVVLPSIEPERGESVQEVTSERAKWALLNTILDRTADTSFFRWQSYLVPDYARLYQELSRMRGALCRLPFVEAHGSLESGVERAADLIGARSRAVAARPVPTDAAWSRA